MELQEETDPENEMMKAMKREIQYEQKREKTKKHQGESEAVKKAQRTENDQRRHCKEGIASNTSSRKENWTFNINVLHYI